MEINLLTGLGQMERNNTKSDPMSFQTEVKQNGIC